MTTGNWYVHDKRNGNKQGPFTRLDALQLAVNLNDFVKRNAGIQTSPFHAKEDK